MTAQDAKHAKMNDLAAQIKDAETSCENNYHAWAVSCERLRQLEREHRSIWLSLVDDINSPRRSPAHSNGERDSG